MPEQPKTQLPVTVIGGYLGAGKTTLINHLLHNANGLRLAILVNDFGDLAIDAALIESQEGDVISLSGGCVCCSYGNDLQSTLMETASLPEPPDHIVIESSGVALPGAIGSALTLLRAMRLHGIVTLADAGTLQQHAADKYLADTIDRQLRDADIIVLNKSDLCTAEQIDSLKAWVATVNNNARIVTTTHAAIANAIVLDEQPHAYTNHLQSTTNHNHTRHYKTAELIVNKNVNATRLATALASDECGLLRAKGFVKDLSGSLQTIQVVGRRWAVTDAPAGVECGLVCIGMEPYWNVETVTDAFDGVLIAI
jgi:G3E family GTPase